MQYLDAISKMTEWFCLSPRQPFKITVIQVYAPNSNAEETEVERFYEDLQELLELTTKKDVLFIIENWNAKVGSQETPGVTGKFWPGNAEWSRVKTNRVLPRKCTGHSKQQTKMDWMDEFNSDDHYIYYWGQESLRRIVNKRVWNAVLGCNLKNDRMISVRLQGNHSKSQLSKSMLQTVCWRNWS